MPRTERFLRFLVPAGTLRKERLDKFLLAAFGASGARGDAMIVEDGPRSPFDGPEVDGQAPDGAAPGWQSDAEFGAGFEFDDADGDGCREDGETRAGGMRDLSREALKKLIRDGHCQINGRAEKSPSAKVAAGDEILLELPDERPELDPEDGPIHLLHEDRDILVLSKEAGLVVHPCPSCPSGTLVQRLAFHVPEIAAMGGLRPGIVHRLDKETSGLLVVAKNQAARLALAQSFAERKVSKRYLAIVKGVPPKSGTCREAVGRDPDHKTRMACVPVAKGGREAQSEFETLWSAHEGKDRGKASLVRVAIHTGRTHQIRVHMAHLGHPLLGDALYGGQAGQGAQKQAPRVMLHAAELAFPHPTTGETLRFTLLPPRDFRDCLVQLARRPLPLVVTGNPGCGKSLVLKFLERAGIPVISADKLVAGYYEREGVVTDWLCRRLGDTVLTDDGTVDRTVLMKRFEASPDFRREVEELCHGLVKGDIQAFFDRAADRGEPLVAAEIPLYFECGWNRGAFSPPSLVVGVAAPRAIREERLARTRDWDKKKMANIESWQWSEEKKMAACDLVIENLGTKEDLEAKVRDDLLPKLNAHAGQALAAVESQLETLLAPENDGDAGRDARAKEAQMTGARS